ncbi:hypothetical protein Cni_G18975 [Canna indica]|uniref:Uncharacterized protein n=1 Tax=Canna indica TaxID=4628 RepID=A0AAQ3QEX4_9LILI|nr:hypothetical protein Cni_G18975 [Canna indica]
MGCSASRLENEDCVRRCKERRRLMKDAVYSRHHLASVHSDYLHSLRLTGSALTRFAKGEPLSVSEQTPFVFLRSSSAVSASSLHPPKPQPPPAPSPPAPPSQGRTNRFSQSPSPSPSVASASAPASFRKTSAAAVSDAGHPRLPPLNSTYAATPSQSSSAWDWENFRPPSPPDSEFFERKKAEHEEKNRIHDHHLPEEEVDDTDEERVAREEEGRRGREEVFCREWGEHWSSPISSSSRSDGERELENDVEDGRETLSRSESMATRSESAPSKAPPSEIASSAAADVKSRLGPRSEAGSSFARLNGGGRDATSSSSAAAPTKLSVAVRHHNLAEIAAALEEFFVKAADAGSAVSDLLEIGRAQFDGSFRQLKKTVYHSNSVLSALSSSWTSKPPLAIRYSLDTAALQVSGGGKSHASTLERLLAWEKKLYEEVKAREAVKIEHEKKLSMLQSQEYKGKDEAKLDKTKASIKKLQSLIIVTSQAVTTTSSAINKVRDDELAPQLVQICQTLLDMWRQMNHLHEVQNQIVQQVRGLVNCVSVGQSTSDSHRLATRDLEAAVSAWHSSFIRLIKYHRDYVRSLYGWLKLTLLQVSSDHPHKDHSSPIAIELTAFCDEWKQAIDRLPDTVASEAIKSFMNVIHVICTKQAEELKIKNRVEAYSKEFEKKSKALGSIEKRYYQSYSMVGASLPGGARDNDGQVFDTRDPLAEKKSEIAACHRKVGDEIVRHANAVEITHSMTLHNIQTGLPGVFQALMGFSGVLVEVMEGVCSRAD